MLATPATSLEDVHALLLVCAWPLPTIRFASDPSSILAATTIGLSMALGLHTGRGAHREFCVGSRQHMTATNEEAASTWLMACTLAQRHVLCAHCSLWKGNAVKADYRLQDLLLRRPPSALYSAHRRAVSARIRCLGVD
jgi:hypothetical protein